MKFSRRDFIKGSSAFCAATLLPAWVTEIEAAEAAAVNKPALADAALTRAKELGANYADIRINRYRRESLFTREQQVQTVLRSQDFGFGVRVLLNGAWGFASSYELTPQVVRQTTEQACSIAKANAMYQRKPVELASPPTILTN